jgi:hypothetical protein
MNRGDICMQVYRTMKGRVRQVRKVQVVSVMSFGGMVMVRPLYGPLRHDTYPIHETDLVADRAVA